MQREASPVTACLYAFPPTAPLHWFPPSPIWRSVACHMEKGLLPNPPPVPRPHTRCRAIYGGVLCAVRALCTKFVQDRTQAA